MSANGNSDGGELVTFTTRPYQQKFLEICKQKNTIVYLPTGSGKTYIASLVLQHFAKDIVRKPFGEGGKRSIFVVNTVVLAKQQAKYFNDTTPLRTRHYTGDLNVDNWKREKWRQEFEEAQLIVATCQIIVDVISAGYLSVEDINVLVFDECHHARGDHPMHQLMSHFERVPKQKRPRVVGLSGMLVSPGVKVENVEDELASLENVFMATIATAQNLDDFNEIRQFSTNPDEKVVKFITPVPTPTIQRVEAMIAECISCLGNLKTAREVVVSSKTLQPTGSADVKKLTKLMNDFVYQMRDMGVYGASISVLSILIEFEVFRLSAPYAAIKNAIRYCVTIVEQIRHFLVDQMEHSEDESEKVKFFASPKLLVLIKLLEKISNDMEDPANKLKVLVFVQRRYTSKCLYHILRRYSEATPDCHVRPDFIVGCNNGIPESIEAILQAKNNKKTLDKFKKNETNLICASSVLEEGIDLQMCNTVIAYDAPQTFTSYAQTKGRARMRESQYIVMIDQGATTKFLEKLSGYQKVEKKLRECLVGKTIDRQSPLDDDVKSELFEHEIQPFYTPSGAKLTGLSSMNLLNRYAMSMPQDKFSNSSIVWDKQPGPMTAAGKTTIIVNLQMPIQSKVNGMISSDPCESIKAGKRSAAFKACKKLYYAKELSENLLPITKDNLIMNIKPVYFRLWDKHSKDSKSAGTKKNRRIHDIVQPHQLVDCHPQPGATAYLYVIEMKGRFNPVDHNQKVFEELHSSSNEFGILTTKRLPELARMSFFVSLGCVDVQIAKEPKIAVLKDEQERKQLTNFHNMIFRDVLGIWKSFFCSTGDSCLIVPTRRDQGDCVINWGLVQEFQNLQRPRELNESERRQKMQRERPEDYLHKVVNPWYRGEEKQYVVTKVHEHLTPMSAFPNSTYNNYAEYYLDKYAMRIMVPDQFMIEVKGISTFLNLLSPGAGEAGKSKRYSEWTNTEMYIPELCHNYQFPADVWLKACVLPSVLHRLHFMLLAENLRVAFAKHVHFPLEHSSGASAIDTEKYVLDKLFKKNDSKTSFYISNYQAAVEDSDDEDETGGYRSQNRSIVYPNPEETAAKTIDRHLNSLCDMVQTMWNVDEEPIDLERHWDNVYPIEVQNYVQFLLRDFADLSIAERSDVRLLSNRSGGSGSGGYHRTGGPGVIQPQAICGDPSRYTIKLLSMTGLFIEQKNMLRAVTTASSGDVFDMERFEVLGDAFLKFIVSFYLIQQHQDWHEGYLTTVKGQIVSNRNLYYCGVELGLPGMIKVARFAPKDDWLPPNLGVPKRARQLLKKEQTSASILWKLSLSDQEQRGQDLSELSYMKFEQQVMNQPKLSNRDTQMQVFLQEQSVADKTVADTMEALLGVCVHGLGIKKAAKFLTLFQILPDTMDLSTLLDRKLKSKRMCADADDEEIDDLLINYQELERELGYRFKDRAYLLQALTHASYPTNRMTGCYQQLEFLGDAVLDFLISAYIFERCPDMNPGQLTDLRSALVNNVTLACICVRNQFHLHILAQNAQLAETISKFCQFQENHQHKITDQVDLLVTESDRGSGGHIADYIDVPKVLGDVFESLIGAVFLDSDNNLDSCWTVIQRLMKNELDEFTRNVPTQLIRRLFEFPGANPKFDDPVVDDDVVMVALRFTCRNEILRVSGFGQNKSDAQKAAAKIAMQHLNAVV